MYQFSWGSLLNLLTCKASCATRVTTRKWFLWRTCVVCSIVRPSVGRVLRLDDVSCILMKLALVTWLLGLVWDGSYDSKRFLLKNLCCLLNGKAFGGSRVKTPRCIIYLQETCALDLLERPWVRRELRLENASCEELVLFT